MSKLTECVIRQVGVNKKGQLRYWCIEHKADASTKHGSAAAQCRYAHIPTIEATDLVHIDLSDYLGGVGIWGAVPPVYDTTELEMERGIHVHARKKINSGKVIDDSFRCVKLIDSKKTFSNSVVLDELDALYFMTSSVFGYSVIEIFCKHCGASHLDKDWFSIHPHRTHLCASCGNFFQHEVIGIGNPISQALQLFPLRAKPILSTNSIKFNQTEYPGGIRIWGTNDAIIWTGEHPEERGIHLHALDKYGAVLIDDTFGSIQIDGVEINSEMVNIYTAQSALPTIFNSVQNIICPTCKTPHFDTGRFAYTPHLDHECDNCGHKFHSKIELISNPLIGTLETLAGTAIRTRRFHDLELIPENLEV
jgi:hypothetical protein